MIQNVGWMIPEKKTDGIDLFLFWLSSGISTLDRLFNSEL